MGENRTGVGLSCTDVILHRRRGEESSTTLLRVLVLVHRSGDVWKDWPWTHWPNFGGFNEETAETPPNRARRKFQI